jgi:hypothetical protein
MPAESLSFSTIQDVKKVLFDSTPADRFRSDDEFHFFARKIWDAAKFDGWARVISPADFDAIVADADNEIADEFAIDKLDDELARGA